MTRSGFKPLRGRLGQRKMKSRPSPLFRFHPDLSAVACNDALYDCKTQACTILVLPIFQPLELFEYFFMVPGVNPDAVITYAKLVELLLAFIPDFDFRGLGLSRKLDGIDQEILKYLVQPLPIAPQRWEVFSTNVLYFSSLSLSALSTRSSFSSSLSSSSTLCCISF